MAKARAIPGLAADEPYGVTAARAVTVRADEVIEHSRGVLDLDDVERVHAMRVATRRLRAALETFAPCFPPRRYRAALREVKDLADALGERRDRDVAIATVRGFATGLPAADIQGARSLEAKLEGEQQRANKSLAPIVTPERLHTLHASLVELATRAGRKAGLTQLEAAVVVAEAEGGDG